MNFVKSLKICIIWDVSITSTGCLSTTVKKIIQRLVFIKNSPTTFLLIYLKLFFISREQTNSINKDIKNFKISLSRIA